MTNRKKRVLLVNNSLYLPGEGGYKRTMYMFDMMRRLNYPVTLVTGDFNHYKKAFRNLSEFKKNYPDYDNIVFLHMLRYKKNISVKRYFSEKYWSYQFKNWFKIHAKEFDVVFFSDADYILSVNKICRKHNIKKIIDIRDLRPEAFKVIVKNKILYNILFFPMKLKADRAYRCADELTAVSEEYLKRGLSVNNKSKNPVVVYIGATLERFNKGIELYSDEICKPIDEMWITYIGTIGKSYDLKTVIDSAKIIEKAGYENIRFKLVGQGPEEEILKEYTKSLNVKNVDFVGFLPYEKMAAFLNKSDITLNAIKKNASASIINKVADYFAAGKPMLNGCQCVEQQEMINEYKVGLNYEAGNADNLADCIIKLINDTSLSREMGKNAEKLANNKFNRDTSYLDLLKIIDNI